MCSYFNDRTEIEPNFKRNSAHPYCGLLPHVFIVVLLYVGIELLCVVMILRLYQNLAVVAIFWPVLGFMLEL